MKSIFRTTIACIVLFVSFTNLWSQTLSDERRNAVLEFSLTMDRADHLIPALVDMTKYVVSLPDYAERLRKSGQMTLAEQVAQVEKDPKATEILKRNSLTARDYLVGVPALRMAILAAGGASSPNIVASAANVAFAKANLSTLKPRMDAADGAGARK